MRRGGRRERTGGGWRREAMSGLVYDEMSNHFVPKPLAIKRSERAEEAGSVFEGEDCQRGKPEDVRHSSSRPMQNFTHNEETAG